MSTFVWRVELLGGLWVFPPDRAVPLTRFSTAKAAALFAFLVLHPDRVHTREALADLFWPDAAPEAARVSLRAALSLMRRELDAAARGGCENDNNAAMAGEGLIYADRQHIEARRGCFTTDVALFEAAVRRGDTEAARVLYRGELLPGVYDDWACHRRERLADLAASFPAAAPFALSFGLPPVLTRGFGRDRDRDAVLSLLSPSDKGNNGDNGDDATPAPRRLVTLTGPGGVGKTRLTTEVCRAAAETRAPAPFEGGVVFVPLADAREASEIAPRIASALSLPAFAPSADPLVALCENLAIRNAPLLLALDNFEQLLDDNGDAVVAALLARAPRVSVVVSSRRRLYIEGEREWTVAPLGGDDAARLFRDRAQNARSDFPAESDTDAAVCSLVDALDGLPLAIELVAARAGALTLSEIRDGLAQNFALVSAPASAATANGEREARHQSLDAAIAWSVALLPAALARFWTTLSVFRGGMNVAAAARIAGVDPTDAAEMLVRLRERSLLLAEDAPGGRERRYRLLETLRAFAADRAQHETIQTENGETVTIARHFAARHFAYFHDLARGDKTSAFEIVDGELPNMRAALDHAESLSATDAERAQLFQYGGVLWRFWTARGFLREGRARLDRLITVTADLVPSATLSAGALAHGRYVLHRAAGSMALRMNDSDEARRYFDGARPWAEASDDPIDRADIFLRYGLLAVREGDMPAAFAYGQKTLERARALPNAGLVRATLLNLANTATYLGNYESAHAYYEETITLRRAEGDARALMIALHSLGLSLFQQGDGDGAATACREALELRFRLRATEIEDSLEFFAMRAAQIGQHEQAARLAGAAFALREKSGAQVTDADGALYDAALAPSRHALGEIAFAQAFVTGQALPEAEAVALALAL